MPGVVQVHTTINGEEKDFLCEPRQSLLEVLRDVLFMTGTKEGCNDGNCGACTVIFDGRIVDSCLVLGVEAQGKEITTIEGLATAEGLHPLQQAFLEKRRLCNAAYARRGSSWPLRACWTKNRMWTKGGSATGWRGTCAAAPGTIRSCARYWTPANA